MSTRLRASDLLQIRWSPRPASLASQGEGRLRSPVRRCVERGAGHAHTRRYARYPSALTDNEWGVVVPFVPPGRGNRSSPYHRYAGKVLNAILYLAEGGIAWRMLPKDFPPVSTVRRYFYQWRDDGTLSLMNFATGNGTGGPRTGGKEPCPSAGIIDSQSVAGKPPKVVVRVGLMLARIGHGPQAPHYH